MIGPNAGTQTQATVSLVNDNSSVTFLHFESDPGDFIGGGQEKTLNIANGNRITANNTNGGASFSTYGGGVYSDDWSLGLTAPIGTIFGVGDYQNAQRSAFKDGHPGLDFSGNGRGSNTLTGNFQVLEVVYDNDGHLLRFAANFEQHSEGKEPGLYGQIRYNSTVPLPASRPVQVVATSISYASESSTSTSPATFTITRTGGTATTMKVSYKLTGSAINGHDYQALKGTVKFKPGKSTAEVKVKPLHTGTSGMVVAKLKILPQDGQYEVSGKAAKIKIYHFPF